MAQFRREGPSPEFVVGLLLQTGQSHMRGVIKGVYRFLRVNPHWRIEGYGHHPLLQWDQLASWRGDGLIGIPENPSQLEQLLDLGVPVVNAGSRFIDKRITTVACDSEAIGREAAEHLLAVGLKHFLFLSELTWENERQRYRAFDKAITQAGFRCDLLPIPALESLCPDASARYDPDLEQLLVSLERAQKPVGVCTPSAVMSRFVVEVATGSGFVVPDEVAVMGTNDDPLVCESTNPHISCVVQPSEQIGFESAKRLDLLMHGGTPPDNEKLFPPLKIAVRRSTDVLAIEDEDVRSALRFMQNHAHEPIDIHAVSVEVAISRRTLEKKFEKLVGRSPALELRRLRLELAKKLLAETSEPITNVCFSSGFNSRQTFSNIFRQQNGMTPSQYRRQFQVQQFTQEHLGSLSG